MLSPALITFFSIVFIEIALSVDNAILLSSFAANLSGIRKQRLSLFAGIVLAVFLRLILIYYLNVIFSNVFVQLLGGLYLLFLSGKYFYQLTNQSSSGSGYKKKKSFFLTVLTIESCDLIFATDSILAAFALVYATPAQDFFISRVMIILAGSLLGMVMIRIASMFLLSLIAKQSFLKHSAHMMIGWIGVKMGASAFLPKTINKSSLLEGIFWSGLALAFISGIILQKRLKKSGIK